jgi:hypothetical protein
LEQSLHRFFGICEFNAAVPPGITETKKKTLHIFFKYQFTSIRDKIRVFISSVDLTENEKGDNLKSPPLPKYPKVFFTTTIVCQVFRRKRLTFSGLLLFCLPVPCGHSLMTSSL